MAAPEGRGFLVGGEGAASGLRNRLPLVVAEHVDAGAPRFDLARKRGKFFLVLFGPILLQKSVAGSCEQ